MTNTRVAAALKASAVHLVVCVIVAVVVAVIVFRFWFPWPFRDLSGGQFLFLLIVSVDVVCGPLLTAVLFNPTKTRLALTVDFSLIAAIQIAALAYGVWSLSMARPVVMAFEKDRFAVVSSAEVDLESLDEAPEEWRALSWSGPALRGTREPRDNDEYLKSLDLSLAGIDPGSRPGWWQEYDLSRPDVIKAMKTVQALHTHLTPEKQKTLEQALEAIGRDMEQTHYLPLVSSQNKDGWIVLLDAQADIVGYAPLDGFIF